MAVATKTLAPTEQVVSLPDMTEKPNASVLVDGIGKEADAINALNSKIGLYKYYDFGSPASSSVEDISTKIESVLGTDSCVFVGRINIGGAGIIVGQHYVANGNHYWQAIIATFGNVKAYVGLGGSHANISFLNS